MLDQQKRDQMATRYRLLIQTLSPLHVGSGAEQLQRRTPDFLPVNGRMVVIDPEKLSIVMTSDQIDRIMRGDSLRELIEDLDNEGKQALAAYTLPDTSDQITTIRPHVKLPGALPYLPGSSLKGAFRTALAWAMLTDGIFTLSSRDIGKMRVRADDLMDHALFGTDPNHDLLRALHVSDSQGVTQQEGLRLAPVAVYSINAHGKLIPKGQGYRFHIETIPEGVELWAHARRDNFILEPDQSSRLHFGKGSEYLLRLPRNVNRLANRLIQQESAFYKRYGSPYLCEFYGMLAKTLKNIDTERSCLLQVAWGTGWTSKTVGSSLKEALLSEIKTRYRLGRLNSVFPKTRRLVEREGKADMPLGWLRVTFQPDGEEISPSKDTHKEQIFHLDRKIKPEDLKIGQQIDGRVSGIASFGAFVDIGLDFNGLIHISELSRDRVNRVEDVLRINQEVRVKIINLDLERRRVGLSLKQV